VENVSWDDVQGFIRKLNSMTGKTYRLPTEAEWEYAARGGKKSRNYTYSGSDDIGAVAWYDGNSGSKTHEVGKKSPNELGIYDMTGNVWEWCSDGYGPYSGRSSVNPTGASSGQYRVLRGGGWLNRDPQCCRVAYRSYYSPDFRGNNSGIRLVLVPVQ
jgi:formylglycine-generating enzyme required for sulfatase activity